MIVSETVDNLTVEADKCFRFLKFWPVRMRSMGGRLTGPGREDGMEHCERCQGGELMLLWRMDGVKAGRGPPQLSDHITMHRITMTDWTEYLKTARNATRPKNTVLPQYDAHSLMTAEKQVQLKARSARHG